MRKTAVFLLALWAFSLIAGVELNGVFDWEKGKTEKVCKGVKYASFALKSPRLIKTYAVRIDLKAVLTALNEFPCQLFGIGRVERHP